MFVAHLVTGYGKRVVAIVATAALLLAVSSAARGQPPTYVPYGYNQQTTARTNTVIPTGTPIATDTSATGLGPNLQPPSGPPVPIIPNSGTNTQPTVTKTTTSIFAPPDANRWTDPFYQTKGPVPSKEAVPSESYLPQSCTGLFDNLSVFLGLDGSKGPEDLGINAGFGYRAAINWGIPLWQEYGIGLQVGSALNHHQNAVSVLQTINDTHDRLQSFTTVGLYQRTPFGLKWGLGYDFLSQNYYNDLFITQFRAIVGYELGCDDEVGIWATKGDRGDSTTVGTANFGLRAITQANLYFKHIWRNDIVTRFWVGLAETHGRFVYVLPDRANIHHPVVFGADIYVPLNDSLAIYGEANFITPNDSGTVTAMLGLAWYPGAKATKTARSRFAPLLPLANNPTFGLDLQR